MRLEHEIDRLKKNEHLNKAFVTMPFIVAAILVALIAYFYSEVFFYFEANIYRIYSKNKWYVNLLITTSGILLSWLIPYFFAKEAIGSGVPQMLAANELDLKQHPGHLQKLVGLKTIIIKMISSILCIFGGGAVGQEGPMLQISAGVFHFTGKKFSDYFRDFQGKMLILIAGGAGIAAAFNTPLGGIAYSIEELSRDHFNKIKSNLILAVMVAGILIQTLKGGYLYLGYPKMEAMTLQNVGTIILVSVVVGLLGILFGEILKLVYLFKKNLSFKKLLFINLAVGFTVWAIAQFFSTTILGAGKHQILSVLFKSETVTWLQVTLRLVGPILMGIAGAAGGLFAPSLTAGVVSAVYLAQLNNLASSNLMALVGMIAFLTGFMRIPFTAFILVMEMTDRQSSLVPMMLAALIAHALTKVVSTESFYSFSKKNVLAKLGVKGF